MTEIASTKERNANQKERTTPMSKHSNKHRKETKKKTSDSTFCTEGHESCTGCAHGSIVVMRDRKCPHCEGKKANADSTKMCTACGNSLCCNHKDAIAAMARQQSKTEKVRPKKREKKKRKVAHRQTGKKNS
jgi:hypothetical protein